MSKHRSDEDDEPIDSEDQSHIEDEIEVAPARRFRPQELMFGTAGRLALGVFGVLLLLGAAAIVNQMINRKAPPVAKKSANATIAKEQQETPNPAPNELDENSAENSGAVTPASATKRVYEPYVPPDYEAPAPAETDESPADSPETLAGEATVAAEEVDVVDEESFVAEPAAEEVAPEAVPDVPPAAAPPPKAPGPLTNTATATPIQTPTRVYVVGKNESLFDVARHELRDAARWTEIYQLNAAAIGDQLAEIPPGTRLRVPQR